MYMHYPVIMKEMEMEDIGKSKKSELLDIMLKALAEGDDILAKAIEEKTVETGTEEHVKPMGKQIDKAYSAIRDECESYEDKVDGSGCWDHGFEDIQETVSSEIESNVKNVIMEAIKSGWV